MREILKGGAAVCASAGIPVAGGHSIDSPEPIYGLAVIGICKTEDVRRKSDAKPGDAIIFHIAETRVAYEFFRSLRAETNTASPDFTGQLGPAILFPRHGVGLDYRDFTGKPTPEFIRTAVRDDPRVWLMLMNNGPADKPDATTVMLTQTLPESFPNVLRWQFPKVEIRVYSRQ